MSINEHILEVRYKANPKILDFRGTWAEGISNHMGLKHWRILENRVDVYNEDATLHAFVGFKSAGFVAKDTDTKNFFSDKAIKYFKYLFSLEGFGHDIYVERLGVRSKFAREYSGDFEEVLDKFTQHYLGLTDQAKKAIDAELIDAGGPLNFRDKEGYFNTHCGPMKSDQLKDFFDNRDNLPKVSLYYDIDYWKAQDGMVNEKEILRKIQTFASLNWGRFTATCKIILGSE